MKKLHWTTWAAMLLIAGALVWCQVYRYEGSLGTVERGYELRFWAYGWPCWMVKTYNPWRIRPAIYNVVSCAILILCTGFVVEKWRRNGWQLRMGSLFRLTAVVAILLAWPKFPAWLRESTNFRPISPYRMPWWLCLPILIGLACLLWAIGWAITRLWLRAKRALA